MEIGLGTESTPGTGYETGRDASRGAVTLTLVGADEAAFALCPGYCYPLFFYGETTDAFTRSNGTGRGHNIGSEEKGDETDA